MFQGRRECRAGLGLVALGRVAGEQDVSGGAPGHGGWSQGTGLRGDPCSGVTGRHALSLLLALEHPGCHGLLTSAHTLPGAPAPGWNNQKCSVLLRERRGEDREGNNVRGGEEVEEP